MNLLAELKPQNCSKNILKNRSGTFLEFKPQNCSKNIKNRSGTFLESHLTITTCKTISKILFLAVLLKWSMTFNSKCTLWQSTPCNSQYTFLKFHRYRFCDNKFSVKWTYNRIFSASNKFSIAWSKITADSNTRMNSDRTL